MGYHCAFCLIFISALAFGQSSSFRYEGILQGPGIPAGTLSSQTFSVSIQRPDGCGGNLGLTAWSTTTNVEDGVFVLSPSFTAASLASAMNPMNSFGAASCTVPEERRNMVITWNGETFTVPLHDAPRSSLSLYSLNSSAIGNVSVQSPLTCSSNQFLKFNSVNSRLECQSLVATDVPTLTHSQIPAASGDVTGSLNTTTVEKIRGVGVSATAPTTGYVLKYNGTNWAPAADEVGSGPADATYTSKGILRVDTSLASSGLNLSSGVLSLPSLLGSAGTIGSSSAIPIISYDQKGRLTSVSSATVNDSTKLPLAGGTMSGSLDMGNNSIVNVNSVASTNVSTRNLVLNDNDINTVTIKTPSNVTTNYSLELPADDGTSGQILSTNGTGVLSWITPVTAGGTVTNVTSGNSYLSIATGTTTPVITANVGTVTNTLAAGNDSRIVGAVQQSAYSADLTPAASCTTSQTPYWDTVGDMWACQNIGTIPNATSSVNFTGSLAGDVSGTQNATSVDKIKGKAVTAATTTNQIMIYNGSSWVNSVLSGDATMTSAGVVTLKNTGTAGIYTKVTTDAQGRVTSGGGLISSDITTALGYTPIDKAGDSMTGAIGLWATPTDPATGGWSSIQKGYTWFNTTSNSIKYWDGSAIQALGTAGSGISSLGGQTGTTQTFAAGAAGTSPAITSASNVHTLNVPLASGASVTSGTISNTDYASFSGKLTSPLTNKGDLLTRDGSNHIRLPAGTNGHVLTADSAQPSGLKWAAASGSGDITDVFAGTGLTGGATSGSATLSVDVGVTSGKILQVDGSNKIPAIDGSNLTNLTAGNLNGVVPINKGGTNSSATLSNGKVMVSSGGAIVEGSPSSTANLSNSYVLRDGSGSFAAATGTFDQLALKNAGSAITLAAPNAFTPYTLTLPTSVGTAGQALISNGAAPASWENVFVHGGNVFGGTATIGANDASNIVFETQNTPKMTILTNGNVGIGTLAPTTSLEVFRSSTSPTEAIAISNDQNASGASTSVGFYNNTGQMGTVGTFSSGFLPNYFASRMNIFASSNATGVDIIASGTNGDVRFYAGGIALSNEVLRLNKAGHIKSSGPAVSITACGSGPTFNGNDARGIVTTASNATTTCTVTFSTAYSSIPICTVSWNGPVTTTGISATVSTTSLVVNFSANSPSKSFSYICMQ